MTTPSEMRRLARKPSASRKILDDGNNSSSSPSEKYARLQDLLRQTLSLAGEIAEELSSQGSSIYSARAAADTCFSDERNVYRKFSRAASEPPFGLRRQLSTNHSRRKLRRSDDSGQDSSSLSAVSSMQEPFSPGSLAMSLDAIVEGKKSDIPLVENSNFIADRLPESFPLTRATTSQGPASTENPSPGSTLGQDYMSRSVASAPIPIPGPPRSRPSASHRASSPGLGFNADYPSPLPEWHIQILPASDCLEPELSTSPPKMSTMPAFVKLEAMFPYRFFSDSHAVAHWSGEGSNMINGRTHVEDEGYCPSNLYEGEHELGSSTERSLRNFIEDWEGTVSDLETSEERRFFHAV